MVEFYLYSNTLMPVNQILKYFETTSHYVGLYINVTRVYGAIMNIFSLERLQTLQLFVSVGMQQNVDPN